VGRGRIDLDGTLAVEETAEAVGTDLGASRRPQPVTFGRWWETALMPRRRSEILLPAEVSDTFGAFTFRPDVALGSWTASGMRYDDQLFLLAVDVDDTAEHRAWIAHFKVSPTRAFRAAGDLCDQLRYRHSLNS
jgi:hypothetical protein